MVIHLKMSADKQVIHLIIALKTDFRVITYISKNIPLKSDFSTEISKKYNLTN